MSNEFIFETKGFGNESQFENSSEFFEGEFEDEFEDEYLGENEDEIRRGASFRRPAYRPAVRSFNRPRSFARRPFAARRPLAGRRSFAARRPLARPGWRRPGTRLRSPYGLRRRYPNYGRRFPLRRSPLYPRRYPSPYPQPYPYPAPYPAPLPSSEQPPPPASTTPASSGAGAPQAISGGAAPPPQEGSEQVRLTQSLLNRVLGLNLPVNGIMDAATRSAIRSFQSQNPDAAPPPPPPAEPAPAEGTAGEPAAPPPGDEQGAPQGEFPYYDDDDAMNFRQRRRLRRGR